MSGQQNDIDQDEAIEQAATEQVPAEQKSAEQATIEQAATVEEVDIPEDVNDVLASELEFAAEQLETDKVSLQNQLEKAQALAQTHEDRALRIQAEMDNLRKRTMRDIENAHKYALEKFINELLPVLDSLELGIAASAENIDDLREGMELTLKMFNTVIEKFDVEALTPQGEKFNPQQHEAISMQDTEGTESGTVVTVMQKGYTLNGRLLRPAMVIVAK